MDITIPPLAPPQDAAWQALIEISAEVPSGWCLVGGQMVHLHCWERGAAPSRATIDADAVLDVRAHPYMLAEFTRALTTLGFTPAGTSWTGHQHRWVNQDKTSIDVLIPRHLGTRADARRGVGGGTTLATPGAQGALNRARGVNVRLDQAHGIIYRPNLIGAIAAKAAAASNTLDTSPARHLNDLLTLGSLITDTDANDLDWTRTELHRIQTALSTIKTQTHLYAPSPRSRTAIAALEWLVTLTSTPPTTQATFQSPGVDRPNPNTIVPN